MYIITNNSFIFFFQILVLIVFSKGKFLIVTFEKRLNIENLAKPHIYKTLLTLSFGIN